MSVYTLRGTITSLIHTRFMLNVMTYMEATQVNDWIHVTEKELLGLASHQEGDYRKELEGDLSILSIRRRGKGKT